MHSKTFCLFAMSICLALTGGMVSAADLLVEDFASGDDGTLPSSLTAMWDGATDCIVQSLATLGIGADHTGGDGYAIQIADVGAGGYNFVYPASTANDTTTDQAVEAWVYYDSTLNSGAETDWGLFLRASSRPDVYPDRTGYYLLVTHDSSWSGYVPTDGHLFILKRDAGAWVQVGVEGSTALSDGWHHLRLTAEGSTITAHLDGAQEIQATDTSYTAGYAGMVAYIDDAGVLTAAFDNFAWSTIETPPPPVAFAPPFQYVGAIQTNGRPLALAGDASGGLYYATFNAVAASGEAGYYIADPLAEIGDLDPSDHVQFGSAEGAGFPDGRGWQGIAVGASGEVFMSGDSGTVGVLARYGAAPTFTPDATFNANAVTNAANRFGGLALLDNTTIAVPTFNSINYFAAADADISAYTNAGGGVNYQREALYNAADDVIYAMRNGNSIEPLISGHYSGGSVATGNYTWTASELIPDGAINTAFGTSTGHGFIDNSVSPPRLYTVDTQSTANGQSDPILRIWDIDAGGTSLSLVGSIDVLTLASTTDMSDCVRVGDTLYVSSTGTGEIYAFQPAVNTSVGTFELYR